MSGARLEVVLEPHPDGFGASGAETVEFRVATNPGMPVSPLRDSASGGELSRVMLALAGPGGAGRRRDLRLRRDRRRASAATPPGRSASACGRWAPSARSSASPTCRRSPRWPTPTSGSRRTSGARRRPPTCARSTATSWSPRSSGCSAPTAATRRPRSTRGSCSKPALKSVPLGAMATTSRRGRARSMRLPHEQGATAAPGIEGPARLGRRTKDLWKRLTPADIAVIDHKNLDRIAAEELAGCSVKAVVNASPSSDGSYPNAGPLTLVRAGRAADRRARRRDLRRALRRRPDLDRGRQGDEPGRRGRGRGPRCSRWTSSPPSSTSSAAGSTARCTTSPRTRCPTSARRASSSRGRSTSPTRGRSSATSTA